MKLETYIGEATAAQVTGQVAGQVAGRAEGNLNCTANSLTVNVKRLLRVLKTDMGINEIMTKIRLSSRTHLRKSALTPALELGLVEMTQPDSPRSPTQKYRLTAKGRAAINNNEHN